MSDIEGLEAVHFVFLPHGLLEIASNHSMSMSQSSCAIKGLLCVAPTPMQGWQSVWPLQRLKASCFKGAILIMFQEVSSILLRTLFYLFKLEFCSWALLSTLWFLPQAFARAWAKHRSKTSIILSHA